MRSKSQQNAQDPTVRLGVSDWLHPDGDSLLVKWRARWIKKGVERFILDEVGIHLLSTPIPEEELEAVRKALKSEQVPSPQVKAPAKKRNQLPNSHAMIAAACKRAETVERQLKLHPLLMLASKSESDLRKGCRAAIETIVGYAADKRRKSSGPLVDEWLQLFMGFEPWLLNWWKADKQKQRITALVNALVGDNNGRLGLIDVFQMRCYPGSPERRESVDAQARLKPDGTEYPRPKQHARNGEGYTRSILIAAQGPDHSAVKMLEQGKYIKVVRIMQTENQRVHRSRIKTRHQKV